MQSVVSEVYILWMCFIRPIVSVYPEIYDPATANLYSLNIKQTLTLRCRDKDGDDIVWLHSGILLDDGQDGFMIVKQTPAAGSDATLLDLIKLSVDTTDAGVYTCQARYSGETDSVAVQVLIGIIPSVVILNGHQWNVAPSESVVLQCQGNENTYVSWWEPDGRQVRNTDPSMPKSIGYVVNNTLPLYILNTSAADTGRYTCRGQLKSAIVEDYIEVIIYGVGIIIQNGPLFTAALGENIFIICDSTLDSSNLHWITPDGNIMTETNALGHYSVSSPSPTSLQLFIYNVTYTDAGIYTCRGNVGLELVDTVAELRLFDDNVFELAPKDQSIILGEVGLVACQVHAYPIPSVYWYKENVKLQAGGRYSFGNQGLTIQTVQFTDGGTYQCQATSGAVTSSRTIRVMVLTIPRITIPLSDVNTTVGKTLTLQCYAEGIPAPTYNFYRDPYFAPVIASGRIKILPVTGTLIISSVVAEDHGSYRCSAFNAAGSVDSYGFVNVEGQAVITSFTSIVVMEHTDAVLTCTSYGPRSMSVTITAQDSPLNFTDPRYTVISAGNEISLTIHPVLNKDEGMYLCTAATSTDSVYRLAYINVVESSDWSLKVVDIPGATTHWREVGETLVVLCVTEEDTVTLTWQDNNGNVIPYYKSNSTLSQRIFVEPTGSLTLELIMLNIYETDGGYYTCFGRTNDETESQYILLNVYKTITFAESLEAAAGLSTPVNLIAGTNGLLPCHPNVAPSDHVQLSWTFNSQFITTADPRYIVTLGGLNIFDVVDNDAGLYECIAEGVSSFGKLQISAVVLVPPQFLREDVTVGFAENSMLHIVCDATGYPEPTVRFYKTGGLLMVSNDRVSIVNNGMTISPTTVDDAGSYVCVATNYVGEVTVNTVALLKELPEIVTFEDTVMKSGQDVYIDCVGYSNDNASMSIQPVNTSTKFTLGDNMAGKVNLVFVSENYLRLTVRNATIDDSMQLQCTIQNDVGSVQQYADFNVTASIQLQGLAVRYFPTTNANLVPVLGSCSVEDQYMSAVFVLGNFNFVLPKLLSMNMVNETIALNDGNRRPMIMTVSYVMSMVGSCCYWVDIKFPSSQTYMMRMVMFDVSGGIVQWSRFLALDENS